VSGLRPAIAGSVLAAFWPKYAEHGRAFLKPASGGGSWSAGVTDRVSVVPDFLAVVGPPTLSGWDCSEVSRPLTPSTRLAIELGTEVAEVGATTVTPSLTKVFSVVPNAFSAAATVPVKATVRWLAGTAPTLNPLDFSQDSTEDTEALLGANWLRQAAALVKWR
jgi:hypothetical protein